MGKRIPAAGSRAARAKARSTIGPLRDKVVSPKQVTVYERAMSVFFAWLAAMQFALPLEVFDLDMLLVEFVENEWSEGGTRSLIGNLLSGFHHVVPALRGA